MGEYDKNQSSIEGGPFGAVGLAKRNLCTGERFGWYEPNSYPSEMQFVANPAGTAEDDGVLLSMVFDGNIGKSYLHVLDARTMKRLARLHYRSRHLSSFMHHGFPRRQLL